MVHFSDEQEREKDIYGHLQPTFDAKTLFPVLLDPDQTVEHCSVNKIGFYGVKVHFLCN